MGDRALRFLAGLLEHDSKLAGWKLTFDAIEVFDGCLITETLCSDDTSSWVTAAATACDGGGQGTVAH